MQFNSSHLFLFLFLFALSSCANYKLNYSKESTNWASSRLPTSGEVDHTVYLIGDCGNYETRTPALNLLKDKLEKSSKETTVIFLGDNIYPDGMPPKGDQPHRKEAEAKLMTQLSTTDNFEGNVIFVPGNHDAEYDATAGVVRQEKFVEAYLNEGIEDEDDWDNFFLPDGNCSGPSLVELTDDLVVIVVNSQWWLEDWERDPLMNYDCEVKDRNHFVALFEEMVRKNRTKNVIVAMHHPLYTYGPHGGRFTLRPHFFPLTELNKKLYIPLPGLGTAATFARATLGIRQDVSNPVYRDMKNALISSARKSSRVIFAAGHEHSLQYIERDSQYFIVSGAGTKQTQVGMGEGSLFSYAHQGFFQLDAMKDGSMWMKVWIPEEGMPNGKVIFQKKIKEALPLAENNSKKAESETYELELSSIDTTIIKKKAKKVGPGHDLIFGKHYRNLYREEYTFPVLNLSQYEGGLEPIKIGGGRQTNSLRLADSKGYEYALRAMTKDASRFIPYPFSRLTSARSLVEDNFLSAHPFAALALPPMQEALGIYHNDPKLFFVPKQARMQVYNKILGNEVFLLERRPEESSKKKYNSGELYDNAEKVYSTIDVLEKLQKDHDHKIDQPLTLRSRMFDILIGDFDRHDDQWRWLRFKNEDDVKIYKPVPKDRDQAFSRYGGVMLGLGYLTLPMIRQLKSFKPKVGNLKWFVYSARRFDRSFLNELTWEDWQKELRFIQQNLDDEVILKGFKEWPAFAFEQTAPELMEAMKFKRDNLNQIARKHYEILAKEVDIVGTNKRDRFEVNRLNDDQVQVKVFALSKKKGKKKEKLYDRIFNRPETKEIRLFGLDGDDEFIVEGEVNQSILIRAIGGRGEDVFEDKSFVKRGNKKTKIYDDELEENQLILGKEAKDLTSTNTSLNQYNRRDFHYENNLLAFTPLIGYNPDDQVFLGGQFSLTDYLYKKAPYGQQHSLSSQFAFATNALQAAYKGEFVQAFGKWDGLVDLSYQSDQFVINYFGYGNESVNLDVDFDFNRVRQSLFRFYPGIQKRIASDRARFKLEAGIESIEVEETPGRFISSDASDLSPSVFSPNTYFGAKASLEFDNVDNPFLPKRGLKFNVSYSFRSNLDDNNKRFGNISSSLTFYNGFFKSKWLVLASRIGVSSNTGELGNFEFFQAPVLGGQTNLRGFRGQRFYGKTAFFHNIDLRAQIWQSHNKVLPFTLGLKLGYDYGRVWEKDVRSDLWHDNYGGGIWIAPLDYFVISTDYFRSEDEDDRFTIRIGFLF